jgi:hypothetical protein
VIGVGSGAVTVALRNTADPFRLAPEILKWLDRKGVRDRELAMQDKALEFGSCAGAQRMSEIGAGADAAWNVGAIETLREAVAAQGQRSGVQKPVVILVILSCLSRGSHLTVTTTLPFARPFST